MTKRRKVKTVNTNPVLLYIRCPMCQIRNACYVRRSNAKDAGLYGKCTKCHFIGYNHNSWLIAIRRDRYIVELTEHMSRKELNAMLKQVIEIL